MRRRLLPLMIALCLMLLLSVTATASDTLPAADESGKITLNEDVTLSAGVEYTTDTIIELAGHALTFDLKDTDTVYAITVKNGATLTIQDTIGEGKIHVIGSASKANAAAVYLTGSGTKAVLKSGTVEIISNRNSAYTV